MARSFLGSSNQQRTSGAGAVNILSRYKTIILGGLGVLGLFFLISLIGNTKADPSGADGSLTDAEISGPIATATIDKSFSVPLRDSQGEELSRLSFRLQNAEKRDEIIVKGQKASTVEGRVFLILNLKIDNTYNKGVDINTKDYIRLSVNGNQNEWFAPDIHNDPVSVQPISTKVSRVGFAINADDSDLILQVGDVESEKELITLNFN